MNEKASSFSIRWHIHWKCALNSPTIVHSLILNETLNIYEYMKTYLTSSQSANMRRVDSKD